MSAARADSIEEKAQLCARCHGDKGVPAEQSFPVPVIWGQRAGYLFFELRDFKSGTRKNDAMSVVAPSLSDKDIEDLAAYFAAIEISIGKLPGQ